MSGSLPWRVSACGSSPAHLYESLVEPISWGRLAGFVSADGCGTRKHWQQKSSTKLSRSSFKPKQANPCSKTTSNSGYWQSCPNALPKRPSLAQIQPNQKSGSLSREMQPHLSNHWAKWATRQHGNNKAIACVPAALRGISRGSGSHGHTCKAQHYDIS